MFPCSSGCYNPFTYTGQNMIEKSFTNDGNPSSGQEHHPASYLQFPAPFLEDEDPFLSHLFSQQELFGGCTNYQATQTENSTVAATNKGTDNKEENRNTAAAGQNIPPPPIKTFSKKKSSNGSQQTNPRKRTGKKDRHSKICTARGPRDRRMRLSLQIARKFFDLQDMLGFDKASKTIEWLLARSKTAIKELTENFSRAKQSSSDGAKSVSETSESEVVSEDMQIADYGDQTDFAANGVIFNGVPCRETKNRKLHVIARDSRDMARARARERTRKKWMIRGLEKSEQSSGADPFNLGQLLSSTPLETVGESCFCSQQTKSSLKMVAEVEEPRKYLPEHQIDSVSINEKFWGVMCAPKSSLIFNYSHNIAVSSGANSEDDFAGFTGNWDNMKPSTGNVQVQIPSPIFTATSKPPQQEKPTSIFTTTSNAQDLTLNSIFMTNSNTHDQNPSSVFITSLNSQEQNPSSNILATSSICFQPHFLENQFS